MHDALNDPDVPTITRLEADRQLQLLETAGSQQRNLRPSTLCVPESDLQMARWLLAGRGLEAGRPWLLLHPGSAQAELAAPYPAGCFARVAQTLAETYGYQVVLTGAVAEQPQNLAVARLLSQPVLNLTGELSLGTLAGLIALAPTLLTGHTGPVHLAAALQTPLVLVDTRSAPQTGLWQGPHRVLYTNVPAGFLPAAGQRADKATIVEAILSLARVATLTN